MSSAVRNVLDAFEALTDVEKHEATVEILRRTSRQTAADIPDATLVEAADELFQELDAREAADACP